MKGACDRGALVEKGQTGSERDEMRAVLTAEGVAVGSVCLYVAADALQQYT